MIRFGNDGWKTRFDEGFTCENVVRVAEALGLMWAEGAPAATLYVGFDTREHSEEYARAAAGVLAACGLCVKLATEPSPTPAVAWMCANDSDAAGAVVLTASELSCDYGGVIVRGSDGGPLSRELLDAVEQEIPKQATGERGDFERVDVMGPYLEGLRSSVDTGAIASAQLKIVVDAMYGSARLRLPEFLRSLGCQVTEVHTERDPEFGGLHPSPSDPWADECEQAVLSEGADLGIVLDCDADRAAVIDEKGRLLHVRELVPFVTECLVRRGASHGRVVTTLTSSNLIERQARRLGLRYTPVSVGFPYIYGEFGEGDVVLGSEEYGGICVPEHLKERDGIFACLLVIERLCKEGVALSELICGQAEQVGRSSWSRRDLRVDSAVAQALRNVLPGINPQAVVGKKPSDVSHADGLRLAFDDGSWVLVRQARTEPVVRVYAEAATSEQRDALIDDLCSRVKEGSLLA